MMVVELVDQNEENCLKMVVELVDRTEEMFLHFDHRDQIEGRPDLNGRNEGMLLMMQMMEFVVQILKMMLIEEHNHSLHHFHYHHPISLGFELKHLTENLDEHHLYLDFNKIKLIVKTRNQCLPLDTVNMN
jgi:RNA binding exosome subunit